MSDYNSEFAVGSFTGGEVVDVQAAAVTGTQNPADWFIESLGGTVSDSGLRVDGYTALTSGSVWQAVSVISTSVMCMPVDVIQEVNGKRRKRRDLPASQLLRTEPHPEYLASAFKELITAWAAIHGNGLARINRAGAIPISLTPLLPHTVSPQRDDSNEFYYEYRPEDTGKVERINQSEMFHIIGPHGGLWGMSLIEYAKNTIGKTLALEKHGASVFRNAARPSGVLERDAPMTPENRRNLRREWKATMAGSDNAGEIAILVDGTKYHPLSMTNEDAQWIEAIENSRIDIASWFNLPPHVLNSIENSSVRANLEEQNKSLWNMGLKPWVVKWQEETERKLFTTAQRKKGVFSVRFDPKGLLSADFETRMKGHAIGRQWGWLSANDVLRIEDMDDIGEQGDKYMVPANMADAETGESFGSNNEPSPPPTEQQPENMEAYKPGLIAELKKIIRLEANKIKQAARKASKNNGSTMLTFSTTLGEFYDKFQTVWCEELQAISSVVANVSQTELCVSDAGETYTEMSREFWSDFAQTSDAETLVCDVNERLTRWSDRAYMAADMILEDNHA